MKLKILTFEQPIGEFAVSIMSVRQILSISHINRREFDHVSLNTKGGPQREASRSRINEIAKYSETPDAAFPTPILLALPENNYSIDQEEIDIIDESHVASIVDGQHRILGLEKSRNIDDFILPVVFILDATDEQMALIFAIINGKQTRVSGSVIYDLFDVVEGRNPYKTCHEIARSLNSNENSPYYRRLKMLGRKLKGSNEALSQGTFITHLLPHISSNPTEDLNRSRLGLEAKKRSNSVLNSYYLLNKDEVIVKILLNLFIALKETFPLEWENTELYNLSKTTGYSGIMKSFSEIYKKGADRQSLTVDFFRKLFIQLKTDFELEGLSFSSKYFASSSSGEAKLRDKVLSALEKI